MKKLKILLTGSDGQVGCHVKQIFSSDYLLISCNRSDLDITDSSAVDSIIEKYEPDFVINCAAYTNVDSAEENIQQAFAVNTIGPRNLSVSTKKFGSILIHISTDYVFSGENMIPYTEDEITKPITAYGKSKLEGEIEVSKNNPKHIILRTAWVFSEHGNNFAKTMLRLSKSLDTIKVVSDQFGGPTYAGDIAYAIYNIVERISDKNFNDWGLYNFSGLPHVSWFEFSKQVFKTYKERNTDFHIPNVVPISSNEFPTKAQRPKYSKLDCTKIENVFSIKPSDWMLGLNKMFSEVNNENL